MIVTLGDFRKETEDMPDGSVLKIWDEVGDCSLPIEGIDPNAGDGKSIQCVLIEVRV
jgi:hypothetical protein